MYLIKSKAKQRRFLSYIMPTIEQRATGCCLSLQMVMYTHQFGPRSGGLSVLLANETITPVWERGGALGDVWVKTEVELVSSSVFQVRAAPPVLLVS